MPGRADYHVYARMRFPIAYAPSYVKSQSFMPWGDCYRTGMVGRMGRKGAPYQCKVNGLPLVFDELAAVNFTYPWRDNFCEQRDFLVGQCPGGYGHQGEDIRPAQCVLNNAAADRCLPYQDLVAAVHDGVIRRLPGNLGAYIVVNSENEHVRFRYLHMNPKFMDADGLLNGRQVSEGEIIGKVATWGDFEQGTSYHLHFNIQVFTKIGWVWVNPYMTLVAAYERLIGGRGTEIKAGEPAPPVPVKLPVILHPTPPAQAPAAARIAAGDAGDFGSAAGQSRGSSRRARQTAAAHRERRHYAKNPAQASPPIVPRAEEHCSSQLFTQPSCYNAVCRESPVSELAAPASLLSRRAWLASALGATASLAFGRPSLAAQSPAFARWVARFPRPRDPARHFGSDL